MTYLPLILLGVMLNAGAQLFLKEGMRQIGHFAFAWTNVVPIGMQIATNPYVLAGLFSYVISVVVWLMVLSRVQVSFAYPMLSIGYIVTAIAGHYFFDETLSFTRVTGILVIMGGIYLVTRT